MAPLVTREISGKAAGWRRWFDDRERDDGWAPCEEDLEGEVLDEVDVSAIESATDSLPLDTDPYRGPPSAGNELSGTGAGMGVATSTISTAPGRPVMLMRWQSML